VREGLANRNSLPPWARPTDPWTYHPPRSACPGNARLQPGPKIHGRVRPRNARLQPGPKIHRRVRPRNARLQPGPKSHAGAWRSQGATGSARAIVGAGLRPRPQRPALAPSRASRRRVRLPQRRRRRARLPGVSRQRGPRCSSRARQAQRMPRPQPRLVRPARVTRLGGPPLHPRRQARTGHHTYQVARRKWGAWRRQ
jgi:hypothetical protein